MFDIQTIQECVQINVDNVISTCRILTTLLYDVHEDVRQKMEDDIYGLISSELSMYVKHANEGSHFGLIFSEYRDIEDKNEIIFKEIDSLLHTIISNIREIMESHNIDMITNDNYDLIMNLFKN